MEENRDYRRQKRREIYSKRIRAKKRTYFFDVKSYRDNDYYLTLTESKKRYKDNGEFYYEKHKIFLYREDLEKFQEALGECIDYLKNNHKAGGSPNVDQADDLDEETDSELGWE